MSGRMTEGDLILVEILTAEPELWLNSCLTAGVRLTGVERLDGCSLRARLPESQLSLVTGASERCGADCRVIERSYLTRLRLRLRRRWMLLTGALTALALIWFSSLFVWQIQVRGCETLSSGQVLRALADCGLQEGSFRPAVSLDRLRGRMMLRLPELQWMTVRFHGSRATVLVTERGGEPELLPQQGRQDLVALRSGLVRRVEVLQGQSLVAPGQTVLQGETLVSGRVESITAPPRDLPAIGEIWAETWPEYTAVCPAEWMLRGERKDRKQVFSLRIGKRRWNFPFYSGKTLDGYVTIVHEYALEISGLFHFPISLIREERVLYEYSPGEADCTGLLETRLSALPQGQILSRHLSGGVKGKLQTMTLSAHCLENIARAVPAEDSES